MNEPIVELARALEFAAAAHSNQRRKGAAQEPYIDHLIEVLHFVASATHGDDVELCLAALLHDIVEDTPITAGELESAFGARVRSIVLENSDDMSLPKAERRRRRIASMAAKSPEARMVKIADAISNLRALVTSPPAGWPPARKLAYLSGCRQLVDAGRGVNTGLEEMFDRAAAVAEGTIREENAMETAARATVVRELQSAIGQAVHLVYVPNTRNHAMTEADVDTLCNAIGGRFPAATVQRAEALFEGTRRPILLARIRSDDTESIVALAQHLCLALDERFIGVEVEGRYIRVYADDTA